MFDLLVTFFDNLFLDNELGFTYSIVFTIGNQAVSFHDWLVLICSLISLIFILVLCCLFIYKIIKLVGGLIR